MRKSKSLRDALIAAIPELRNEGERLKIWVEDGKVRATATENHGFEFSYPLSVLLEEVSTDIAIVALAIVRWARVNQPDLLLPNTDSFGFEADILDNGTADILFTVQLTESVAATPNEDGSTALEYVTEPDPLFEDGLAPPPLDPDAEVVLTGHTSVDRIVADG